MPDRSEVCPTYEEFAPTPALADFIACFWNFSIPLQAQSFQHAVIPDGTISLVFIRKRRLDLRLLRICGPRATGWWVTVDPGDSFWGARLLPGAAGPLLGIRPRALQNQVQPLADIAPLLARGMLDGLHGAGAAKEGLGVMEAELARLTARTSSVDPVVQQAAARLVETYENTTVARLAMAAHISERQFRRRFCEAVGLTPKQFSRAVRVRYACILDGRKRPAGGDCARCRLRRSGPFIAGICSGVRFPCRRNIGPDSQLRTRRIRRISNVRFVQDRIPNSWYSVHMKVSLPSLALLSAVTGLAQPPDMASQQIQAMRACSFLVGHWSGNGWMSFGPGQRRPFHETEGIEPKLDGLLLEVEGMGTHEAGRTVHSALAILSFDPETKHYHFRAYDGMGHYMDTIAGCKSGTMTWTLPMGPRQMHYTIRLNQKGQWDETGEMSINGQAPHQFFEMILDKTSGK